MEGKDAATGAALVRKRTDTELMPPPPPAKRILRPKTVLDEDTYTDGLSKIIARDFFPGLLESETQSEYLDALESKDPAWISSASQRLLEVMTPGGGGSRLRASSSRLATPAPSVGGGGATPRGFAGDTPSSVRSVQTPASATARGVVGASSSSSSSSTAMDTKLSLAAFQARYTSEDNESFYRLLDRQNQKRAEKHAWLWNGNKLPSKMQLKQKEVEDRLAASGVSLTDDGYHRDRLAIKDRDDRPAAPETWKAAPKNALMFHPDGAEESGGSSSTGTSAAQTAQAASMAPPKSVVYANTRLPGTSLLSAQRRQQGRRGSVSGSSSSASVPPSPTLSAVRDALAGRPRRIDADSTVANSTVGGGGSGGGGETPRVNGYAFVDDEEPEPAPAPEPGPAASASALLDFSKGDSTPNPFQLQAMSKREGLHHRMVERIAQSKRTSARVGLTGRIQETPATPVPHSPRVQGNLTPAGQRLWSKIGGAAAAREKDAIAAFNGHRHGPQHAARGSRRARLRDLKSAYH